MLIQPPPVGISIAVILLIALIGLNINRISSYYTTRFGRASLWPVVAPSRHDDSDSDSDHTAKSTGSSRSSRSGKSSQSPTRRLDDKSEHVGQKTFGLGGFFEVLLHNYRYAPLFGRWYFHSHIPGVRSLGKYRWYEPAKKTRGGASRPASPTSSGWGDEEDEDDFTGRLERDYPLHRARVVAGAFVEGNFLRPLARLVPKGWLGSSSKEKTDDNAGLPHSHENAGDDDGVAGVVENSIRSSMRRTGSWASVTVDSWDLPAEPLRRRRTQQSQSLRQRARASGGYAAGLLLPWRWRRAVENYRTRHNPAVSTSARQEGSEWSIAASMAVSLDPNEDDSPGCGRGNMNADGEGARPGTKGVVPLEVVLLPFLGGRKVKVEDVESGKRQ
jgi:hypothetical protein